MKELIVAVGLLFVIEGLLYTIFPTQMKKMLQQMQNICLLYTSDAADES